jgi:hypothetical protein
MLRLKTINQRPKTNLPMNPYLTDDEIEFITEEITNTTNN